MAVLNLLFVSVCALSSISNSSDYTTDTLSLICGRNISISRYIGNSSTPPNDNDITNNYGATLLPNSSSYFYNCFTYALLVNNNESSYSESDLFFINRIEYFINGGNSCFGLAIFEHKTLTDSISDIQVGDIILYRFHELDFDGGTSNFSHAAVVTQVGSTLETTKVISKWREFGIYEGYVQQSMYYSYYPPFGEHIYETEFDCYRIQHNYNSFGCITSLNRFYHKKECQYCSRTTIETHNFITVGNRTICSTCGYQGGIINAPND